MEGLTTKNAYLTLALAVLALVTTISVGHAQRDANKTELVPYRKAENWPELPTGVKLGTVVAILPVKGHVWMLQRSEPPIIEVDEKGKYIKSFGDKMFAHAHGMCMDRNGDLWVGDSGGPWPGPDGQRELGGFVFYKFDTQGKRLMTLGKWGVSRIGEDTFVAPTSCIEAPNGDLLIGDGHIPRSGVPNQDDGDRLLRFSKEGKFITAYGKTGREPGQFRNPHQLAYDSRGRLFVADRQNNRLQIFDQNMTFIAEWKQFGRPSGLAILKDDTLLTLDSESGRVLYWLDFPGDDVKALRNPGFTIGLRMGSAKSGDVALHFDAETTVASEVVSADEMGNLYTDGIKWEKVR